MPAFFCMFRLSLLLFLFLLTIFLLPVGVEHVLKEFSHGFLKGIVVRSSGIDEVINHFHDNVVVDS
jgi:hypothetical protein